MTQTEKTPERGGFVQYPCQLIYNCPNLSRDDKWVLLSIMGVCWTEGPYRLSYRDIAALSGVPLSLLSSIAEKDGKPAKEGIMDRLKRLEYVRCVLGKETDTTTGKAKGNAQTYIYVNYKKIWGESTSYKGDAYKVKENYEPVLNTNTPVSYTNRFVPNKNSPVPNTNEGVPYTNEPVRDSRSKVGTYITYINSDKEDSKDSAPASADRNALSPSLSKISLLDDFVFRIAIDDWMSHKAERPQEGKRKPLLLSASAEAKSLVTSLQSLQPFQVASKFEDDTNYYADLPGIKSATSEQNAEVWRKTNVPTPLAENITHADESLSGIERETAVRPSSSLVVDSPNAEMTHTDARNTTNSYSPSSTSTVEPTETPATPEPMVQPAGKGKGVGKGKGSGKKTTEKQDDSLKARMEDVYVHFETIARELFDDPEYRADRATSTRTELYKAVVKFIDDKGSREGMRLVFMDMWNEKSSDGEYWWRHPDHLTLRALCKNYSTRLASVRFNAKKQAGDKLPRPSSGSGRHNYTFDKTEPTPPSSLPYSIAPQSSNAISPEEQKAHRGEKLFMKRSARNIS